jgi:hypothetical protein
MFDALMILQRAKQRARQRARGEHLHLVEDR